MTPEQPSRRARDEREGERDPMTPAASRKTPLPVSDEELDQLTGGAHHDPHSILGPHLGDGGVTIRVLRPWAKGITVVSDGQRVALEHERAGVFVGVLPLDAVPDYRLEVEYEDRTLNADDPYRFLPTLGELDLHLIGEGRHERLWHVLGAHVRTYPTSEGDVTGTSFAVWAPSARGVRVVGDFNH